MRRRHVFRDRLPSAVCRLPRCRLPTRRSQLTIARQRPNRGTMTTTSSADWLLGVHAAATLFMVGLIWFVQVVHYPLFAQVGSAGFCRLRTAALTKHHLGGRDHRCSSNWSRRWPSSGAGSVGNPLSWAGLTLLAIIWGSTWPLQVPAHARLERGFDAATHRRLVTHQLGAHRGLVGQRCHRHRAAHARALNVRGTAGGAALRCT